MSKKQGATRGAATSNKQRATTSSKQGAAREITTLNKEE